MGNWFQGLTAAAVMSELGTRYEVNCFWTAWLWRFGISFQGSFPSLLILNVYYYLVLYHGLAQMSLYFQGCKYINNVIERRNLYVVNERLVSSED